MISQIVIVCLQCYARMRWTFNVGKSLILLLFIWLIVLFFLSGPLLRYISLIFCFAFSFSAFLAKSFLPWLLEFTARELVYPNLRVKIWIQQHF
jgi:hypothetical protein